MGGAEKKRPQRLSETQETLSALQARYVMSTREKSVSKLLKNKAEVLVPGGGVALFMASENTQVVEFSWRTKCSKLHF